MSNEKILAFKQMLTTPVDNLSIIKQINKMIWRNREEVATDWLQTVQTNSVCDYHVHTGTWLHSFVQTLNGRQVLIDVVCRIDEWFTSEFLPIACP